MDLGPQKIFLKDPSAASITSGLEANEYIIDGVLPYNSTTVTATEILCAQPCDAQTYTVTFSAVDFGDCNDCGKSVALVITLRRHSNFDIQDYLHLTSRIVVSYEPDQLPTGTVTAADIADWFADEINSQPYDDEHDFFGISASAAAGVLTLTVNCPNKVDIFNDESTKSLLSTELPVIAETDAGADAVLTKDQLQKEFPLIIGYVPGQGPDVTFTGCQDICVIKIQGCISACADPSLLTTQNAVHLHDVATKFQIELFVNSSAPGYADFIAALNAALPAGKAVTLTYANAVGSVSVAGAAGDTNIDLAAAGLIDGGTGLFVETGALKGTLSNGLITVAFSLAAGATETTLFNAIEAALAGAVTQGASTTDGVLVVPAAGPFHVTTGSYTLIIEKDL
mgnify:CR=1 FL=1|tara:strand:+ start:6693 stop:7883 length:1191 start_codon:yes stop_codon:yes gene_type:complete